MKIERYYSLKEDFGLKLEYCGIEHCIPDFVQCPHSRDVFLMHYVFSGSGIFERHDVKHPFSAGSLFMIFPHDIVSYYSLSGEILKFCWVGFSGETAARMVERIGLTPDKPVCNLTDADSLIVLVKECIEKYDIILPHTELLVQSSLYSIFGEIVNCRVKQKVAKQNGYAASEHVNKAKSYIRFNYMMPLTIRQIAQHINLERTYFSRIFYQIEGITPQEYLLHYRIGIAKRLLLQARYSIKEVGTLVGISDPYYFSRAFKKITGLPPSQYNQNISELPS